MTNRRPIALTDDELQWLIDRHRHELGVTFATMPRFPARSARRAWCITKAEHHQTRIGVLMAEAHHRGLVSSTGNLAAEGTP